MADAPAYHSTCTAINENLLAVGGYNETATNAIHMYNTNMNTWDLIGNNMLKAKCASLVAVLSTNEMLVDGGTVDAVTTMEK